MIIVPRPSDTLTKEEKDTLIHLGIFSTTNIHTEQFQFSQLQQKSREGLSHNQVMPCAFHRHKINDS